jgi:hypothetical protein
MTRPALTRDEIRLGLDHLAENGRRLSACPLHTFVPIEEPGLSITRKCRCTSCHGTIDRVAYQWYMKGREQAEAARAKHNGVTK